METYCHSYHAGSSTLKTYITNSPPPPNNNDPHTPLIYIIYSVAAIYSQIPEGPAIPASPGGPGEPCGPGASVDTAASESCKLFTISEDDDKSPASV